MWKSVCSPALQLMPSTGDPVAAVGEDYIKLNAGNIFIDLTQWEFPARLELSSESAVRRSFSGSR